MDRGLHQIICIPLNFQPMCCYTLRHVQYKEFEPLSLIAFLYFTISYFINAKFGIAANLAATSNSVNDLYITKST